MHAMVASAVFAAALSASIYAIWSTLAPAMPRIVDLLRHGPAEPQVAPAMVPARSSGRDVRRVAAFRPGSPARAAA